MEEGHPIRFQLFQKGTESLTEDALKVIFNLSNKTWITRNMETALILPFVKPGKDSSDAKGCRPIALTSHLCRWMKKMVVYRSEYVVGNNKLLNEHQSGFKRGRSMADTFVNLNVKNFLTLLYNLPHSPNLFN